MEQHYRGEGPDWKLVRLFYWRQLMKRVGPHAMVDGKHLITASSDARVSFAAMVQDSEHIGNLLREARGLSFLLATEDAEDALRGLEMGIRSANDDPGEMAREAHRELVTATLHFAGPPTRDAIGEVVDVCAHGVKDGGVVGASFSMQGIGSDPVFDREAADALRNIEALFEEEERLPDEEVVRRYILGYTPLAAAGEEFLESELTRYLSKKEKVELVRASIIEGGAMAREVALSSAIDRILIPSCERRSFLPAKLFVYSTQEPEPRIVLAWRVVRGGNRLFARWVEELNGLGGFDGRQIKSTTRAELEKKAGDYLEDMVKAGCSEEYARCWVQDLFGGGVLEEVSP